MITSQELMGSGGVLDELARQVLAEHSFMLEEHVDEQLKKLMSDMFNLKISKAKIRMEIKNGEIGFWSGWISMRSALIKRLRFTELLEYLGINDSRILIVLGEMSEGEITLGAASLQGTVLPVKIHMQGRIKPVQQPAQLGEKHEQCFYIR